MLSGRRRLRQSLRNRDVGLRYEAGEKPIEGYTDSDWGVRHSTTGYVFMYNQACISWASKKQSSVALSSCEAEIMAASEAAKEAVYLGSFLGELDGHDDSPIYRPAPRQQGGGRPRVQPRAPPEDQAHRPASLLHPRVHREPSPSHAVRQLARQPRRLIFTKPLNEKNFFRLRDIIMNVQHDPPSVP